MRIASGHSARKHPVADASKATGMRIEAVWVFVLAGLASPASAQVVFPVTFDASAAGISGPERAVLTSHFQEAGRRWVAVLDISGARSIEIVIGVDDAIPFSNGNSVTSSEVASSGGRETFEQGAAAELRTGTDPNGAAPDVQIRINTTYLRDELWFDPDPASRSAEVPLERTDAMSMALHELGHALAYAGWANGQGLPPATFWSTFDRWMVPGAPTLFAGPAVVDAFGPRPDLTTNNIHHWANQGAVPTGKSAASRDVLVSWRNGAPQPESHCDGVASVDLPASSLRAHAKGNLPPGLIYELMNGVLFYRGSRYDISTLDIAALQDAGLPVKEVDVFANGFEGS
jgi:hypothetical protein